MDKEIKCTECLVVLAMCVVGSVLSLVYMMYDLVMVGDVLAVWLIVVLAVAGWPIVKELWRDTAWRVRYEWNWWRKRKEMGL